MGYPTVFIRTTGCNLRCTYCDTKYSYYEGDFLEISEVISKTQAYSANHVCITGGEPLLQPSIHSLMTQLCDLGYTVSIETSGAKSCRGIDTRVKIILDIKTPSSGEVHRFDFDNLKCLPPSSEIKFVIGSQEDFEWSEQFCRQHEIFGKFNVLYSPVYGKIEPQWLAENILSKKSKVRLQLQLHKYIWSADTRGV